MASLPLSLWMLTEDDDPEPTPSLGEALKALTIVQHFVEHQEDASVEDTILLHRLER
ncbi:hypothetical protein K469DRAFT_708169 [Zopfia rhizophila CBS 207.26]|uniref:Uncharacterized protein n=1 Tax=Zopfia rhizophila CBS 207.26 TaxID=1314779 RepID=A0A6A6E2Z5_9PEZI|nr:hypothetical protein K469DRAFT_708169 [Zopfia rhizophila CBS 207.26]